MKLFCVILFNLVLIFRAEIACANSFHGPFASSSNSVFSAHRNGLIPYNPFSENDFYFSKSIVNGWGYQKDNYLIDYELAYSRIGTNLKLSNFITLHILSICSESTTQLLDHTIQSFHDDLNLGQGGRDQFTKNASTIDLGDGNIFYANGISESIRADIILDFNYFSLSMGFNRNSYNGILLDHSNIQYLDSYGIFIQSYIYIENGIIYYGLGGIFHSSHNIFNFHFNNKMNYFFLAWEAPLNHSVSFIAQTLATDKQSINRYPFNTRSIEFIVGIKYKIKNTIIEIGVIENGATFDNSPDFGIHGGITIEIK